jgi:hypothetical protein
MNKMVLLPWMAAWSSGIVFDCGREFESRLCIGWQFFKEEKNRFRKLTFFKTPPPASNSAVNQNYSTKAEDEYVIRGNDVLIKCKIPSFVSDFVAVSGWVDETLKEILPQPAVDSKTLSCCTVGAGAQSISPKPVCPNKMCSKLVWHI